MCGLSRIEFGDDDNVARRFDVTPEVSDDLTDNALHAIAYDRIADFRAHCDSESGVGPGAGRGQHHEVFRVVAAPVTLNVKVLPSLP